MFIECKEHALGLWKTIGVFDSLEIETPIIYTKSDLAIFLSILTIGDQKGDSESRMTPASKSS